MTRNETKNAIAKFMEFGMNNDQSKQAIMDIDTCCAIIKKNGKMPVEAIIGFRQAVVERNNVPNVSNYVNAIVNIANKLVK